LCTKAAQLVKERGGTVLLSHPVCKVEQSHEEGTVLHTENGKKFKAKYVIMAIPPTQQARMSFSPPMPYIREQMMQRLFMGSSLKIVVVYKNCFWRDKGFSGELLCANLDILKNPVSFTFDVCVNNERSNLRHLQHTLEPMLLLFGVIDPKTN
jgi:monoamine oxidase